MPRAFPVNRGASPQRPEAIQKFSFLPNVGEAQQRAAGLTSACLSARADSGRSGLPQNASAQENWLQNVREKGAVSEFRFDLIDGSCRSAAATVAPASDKRLTMDRPMPPAAPVTSALRPDRSNAPELSRPANSSASHLTVGPVSPACMSLHALTENLAQCETADKQPEVV